MTIDGWIDHAERALHVLARDLRAVPVNAATRRLHLRALELKREVARWHDVEPDVPTRCAVLDEIEELSREALAARRRERRESFRPSSSAMTFETKPA